jgi:protein-disulfide isomerase
MYPGGAPDPHQQPQYQPPQDPYQPTQAYPPPVHQQPYYPPQPLPPPPPKSPPTHLLLIAVAAVALLGMMVVGGVALWAVSRPDPKPPVPGPTAQPPTRPADPADGLVVGTGKVRVDVYVDYQCPPCSTFEELTGDELTGYLASDRVTLSIHPVAFIDRRSTNQYSTRSAAAMACAHEQGKTMELHSYLLRHQPEEDTAGPTDQELVIAGNALGMGSGWAGCVTGGEKLGWVEDATTAANADDIDSVPAVRVNNTPVKATRTDLVTAIDNAP